MINLCLIRMWFAVKENRWILYPAVHILWGRSQTHSAFHRIFYMFTKCFIFDQKEILKDSKYRFSRFLHFQMMELIEKWWPPPRTKQLSHLTQSADGRHRDRFLPLLTPSLSSISLPALLSLHIYKAACFIYHQTGKQVEFQAGGLMSCWPVFQHFLFVSWFLVLTPITLFWSVVLIHFQI